MFLLLSGSASHYSGHIFSPVKINVVPSVCKKNGTYYTVPGFSDTIQSTENCDYFNPNHTSLALNIFYIHWYSHYGDVDDEVLNAINEMNIVWKEIPIRTNARIYSLSGQIKDGAATKLNGLCRAKEKTIFVFSRRRQFMGDEKRISKTSFIHELIHYALYYSTGTADPDHEGPAYEGWTRGHTHFINNVNRSLQSVDL
jgi:hypothetical protein